MNVRYILIGALILAALFAVHRFFPDDFTPITNYPSNGTDIIAFGDSLVVGLGSTAGNDFVTQLARKIKNPIVNLGENGNTTADALARISALDGYRPKVVILLLGGNDYLKRVDPEKTFENLSKIIEEIQKRGATVLLLGVRGGVIVDHFKPQFETLRETYHTVYQKDVLDGLFGNTKFMSDEVHPNDAGYALIADRVAPVLASLLK